MKRALSILLMAMAIGCGGWREDPLDLVYVAAFGERFTAMMFLVLWAGLLIVGLLFGWHYWRFHRRHANIDEAFTRIQYVFDNVKRGREILEKNISHLSGALDHLRSRVDDIDARVKRMESSPAHRGAPPEASHE